MDDGPGVEIHLREVEVAAVAGLHDVSVLAADPPFHIDLVVLRLHGLDPQHSVAVHLAFRRVPQVHLGR